MIKFDKYNLIINNKTLINNLTLDIKKNTYTSFVIGSNGGKTMLFKDLFKDINNNVNMIISEDASNSNVMVPTDIKSFYNDNIFKKINKSNNIDNLLFKYHLSSIDKDLNDYELCKLLLIYITITKPTVVVLDNTFTHRNHRELIYLLSELKKLQKELKTTVLYLTNKMSVASLFDKIGLFINQELIFYGNKKLVINEIIDNNILIDLPFYVTLSHHLMFYDMIDQLYYTNKQIGDALWK